MNKLTKWLNTKLDAYALAIRAARTAKGHDWRQDLHYCAGWADGYIAAQRAARKASRQ